VGQIEPLRPDQSRQPPFSCSDDSCRTSGSERGDGKQYASGIAVVDTDFRKFREW
jgi:hypothetical protein